MSLSFVHLNFLGSFCKNKLTLSCFSIYLSNIINISKRRKYAQHDIQNGTCPCRLSTKANKGNHLSPPHRRDFKDCKQILEDLLTPTLHIKARARLSLFPFLSNNERLALMGIRNRTVVIILPQAPA